MPNYHYYKGDWTKGKVLLDTIEAETLPEADTLFQEKHGIDPKRDNSITVTLAPLDLGKSNERVGNETPT